RTVASHSTRLTAVETGAAIRDWIGEQVAEEVPTDTVNIGDEESGDPPHVRGPLAQPVTGELDVARLFGDVNTHEPLDHWLQFGIIHHLPLQRIEDLLADQRRDPQHRSPEPKRQRVDD